MVRKCHVMLEACRAEEYFTEVSSKSWQQDPSSLEECTSSIPRSLKLLTSAIPPDGSV